MDTDTSFSRFQFIFHEFNENSAATFSNGIALMSVELMEYILKEMSGTSQQKQNKSFVPRSPKKNHFQSPLARFAMASRSIKLLLGYQAAKIIIYQETLIIQSSCSFLKGFLENMQHFFFGLLKNHTQHKPKSLSTVFF